MPRDQEEVSALPKPWEEQGCAVCRAGWETGSRTGLRHVGASEELNTRLYQCEICRAYWKELERLAHEVALEEADALQEHPSFVRDPLGG